MTVERIDHGDGPVVLLCEHASNALPEGGSWGEDAWLADTHWAWDPGAAKVTRELARRLGGRAVLSGASRLLVDPNRPLDSPTLFRDTAEGRPVQLNRGLTEAARAERIARYWQPFHAEADRVVGASSAGLVLSVHSFTPVYEGEVREVEVGVLFDHEEALAMALLESLAGGPFVVQPNAPWSGRNGLMYSPERHAAAHGKRALEIELRQDLLADPGSCAALVDAVERGLRALFVAGLV